MAEHKADTYNMFKSLVRQFPEYNDMFTVNEEVTTQKEANSKTNSTNHVDHVEIKPLKRQLVK